MSYKRRGGAQIPELRKLERIFLDPSINTPELVNKMTHQTTYILTNESAIVWCITRTSQCKRHKMRRNAELLA